MDASDTRVVGLKLSNGTTALVQAVDVDGGATKTSFGDVFDFEDVVDTLTGLSDSIRTALAKAAPDKVTVDLSIELALKSGRLTCLLVEGQGKGALSVKMEWHGAATGATGT